MTAVVVAQNTRLERRSLCWGTLRHTKPSHVADVPFDFGHRTSALSIIYIECITFINKIKLKQEPSTGTALMWPMLLRTMGNLLLSAST